MAAEALLTQAILKRLRTLRAHGSPVWWIKLHGNQYQKAGVPDLLIVYAGRAIFVECKAPGKKPTPLQTRRMTEVAAAGGTVTVITSLAQFNHFLFLIGVSP